MRFVSTCVRFWWVYNGCMYSTIKDKKLLRRLDWMANNTYSIRHAQTLLDIEGYKRPSLDFIWRFFSKNRKRIKRIK